MEALEVGIDVMTTENRWRRWGSTWRRIDVAALRVAK
jgi:hypothetical protein